MGEKRERLFKCSCSQLNLITSHLGATLPLGFSARPVTKPRAIIAWITVAECEEKETGKERRGGGSGDNLPITGNYVLGGPLSGHESIEEDRGDMG